MSSSSWTTKSGETGSAESAATASTSTAPTASGLLADDALLNTNPGVYEDLHKKTKDLSPVIFEGFKFALNKMLSTHFQVNHSLTLSSVHQSGYKFGATYVGNKQITPSEVS